MVATQGYGQQANQNADDPFAFINGGNGARAIKFTDKDQYGNTSPVPLGTAYTGVLRENPAIVPQYKFGTQEVDTYADGNEKKQVRLTLEQVMVSRPDLNGGQWTDVRVLNTGEDGDDEDEGVRALYVKDQSKQALADAAKAAGVRSYGIGTRVIIRFIDQKPSQKGNPQKIYAMELSEIQPYVADATLAHEQQMAQAGAGGQWAQNAPADPSQGAPTQFVTPAQPAFAGQVVPVQQAPAAPQQVAYQPPAAPQQLPNTGAQLPQVPQQVAPSQGVDYAALGAQIREQATQPVAPAAPQGPVAPAGVGIDYANAVAQLRQVLALKVPRAEAIKGVAATLGISEADLDAADANTPF
jgi:hypothetical protein